MEVWAVERPCWWIYFMKNWPSVKNLENISISLCSNFIQVNNNYFCKSYLFTPLGIDLRAFRIDGTQDPMSELIKSYRERMDVLCLDEFQVIPTPSWLYFFIFRSLISLMPWFWGIYYQVLLILEWLSWQHQIDILMVKFCLKGEILIIFRIILEWDSKGQFLAMHQCYKIIIGSYQFELLKRL